MNPRPIFAKKFGVPNFRKEIISLYQRHNLGSSVVFCSVIHAAIRIIKKELT